MTDRQFVISRGEHQRAKSWERKFLSLQDVKQLFEIHVTRADKDGPAFVAGAIIGQERKAVAVERMSFLVFDVDGVQSLAEIESKVAATGKFAILYTTHNHKQKTDYIKTDQYSKWAAKAGLPAKHTTEGVLQYLAAKAKKHYQNVKVGEKPEQTAEGVAIPISFDPIDKVRIVFPLERDFIMADSGGYTSAEHIQAWKQTYAGVGQAIGLDYDKACLDPSRLNFLPSHRSGAEYHYKLFEGPLLDYRDYQKADIASITTAKDVLTTSTKEGLPVTYGDGENVFNGTDMNEWLRLKGRGLGHRLIEIIGENDVTDNPRIRGPRGSDKDGVHIVCPFEDEHSTTGGDGTFFDPGPTDNYDKHPLIRCMHAHCKHRMTEDFITKMLVDGWFTYEQLSHAAGYAIAGRNGLEIQRKMMLQSYREAQAVTIRDVAQINTTMTDEQKLVVDEVDKMIKEGTRLPEDYMHVLVETRYIDSFDRVFDEHVALGHVADTPALRIYSAAFTQLGITMLRKFYKDNAAKLHIRYTDFTDLIGRARRKRKPVAQAIDDAALAKYVNNERREEIQRIAEYYEIPAREVQTMLEAAEKAVDSQTARDLRDRTDAMFGHYVVFADKTQLWFVDTEELSSDGRKKNSIHTRSVLAQRYANVYHEVTSPDGKVRRVDLFEWWVKNRKESRYVNEVGFRPDRPPNNAPDADPMLYNLYTGIDAVKPIKGDASPFYNHVLTAWCKGNKRKADWLITWMADIVQNPGVRPATAIVIHGGQGTGKSIIFDHCLSKVLAPYAVTSNRREDITGRFNAILKTTLLFVAEEAVFAGDPGAAARIKSYISSETFTLENKNMDTTSARLFARFVFLTNDFHAMRLDEDDRRFCVIETDNAYKQKVEYFQDLRRWFDNGGNEIVFHYLKNWNPLDCGLTWGSLFVAPVDEEKLAQKRLSIAPVDTQINTFLQLGQVKDRGQPPILSTPWSLHDQSDIPVDEFNDAVALIATKSGRISNTPYIVERLRLFAGMKPSEEFPQVMVQSGGQVITCYRLPSRRELIQRAHTLGHITDAQFETWVGEAPDQPHNEMKQSA